MLEQALVINYLKISGVLDTWWTDCRTLLEDRI